MRGVRGRDALVRAVRGWAPNAKDPVVARALAASLAATDAWAAFFTEAAKHGVAFPAFETLRPFVPKDVARKVEELLATVALESELSQRALAKCLGVLAAAGIRVAVLKGTPLAERYYGSAGARQSNDIDLLVAEADLERALAALSEVGYRAKFDKAGIAHYRSAHHHLVLEHDVYPLLELHFAGNVAFGARLASEPLLERSIRWTSATGTTMRVLAPEDEFVFLAMHAASHRFSRLVWLLDLSLFSRVHAASASVLVARGRDVGLGNLVTASMLACRETFGLAWPESEGTTFGPLATVGLRAMNADSRDDPNLESLLQFVASLFLCDAPSRALAHASKKLLRDLPFRFFSRRIPAR